MKDIISLSSFVVLIKQLNVCCYFVVLFLLVGSVVCGNYWSVKTLGWELFVTSQDLC